MAMGRISAGRFRAGLCVALGVGAGVVLALRGLSPTGSEALDWPVLVVVCSLAVWTAASAPWWTLSATSGVAAALASSLPWMAAGAGFFGLSLWIGLRQQRQPLERAVVATGTVIVFSACQELGWWGVNTALAVAAMALVAVLGFRRRSRQGRRVAAFVVAGAGAVVFVGVLGLAMAAAAARPDLELANRTTRAGLEFLGSGEFDAAQESFARASDAFERAEADLNAVWAQPAQLLPVVSQHRRAGVELVGAAARTTATLATQLGEVDLDSLRIVDGRIDLDAVLALQPPMRALQAALADVEQAVVSSQSGWLVTPVRDVLEELRSEVADQQSLAKRANAALEVAPTILGADGEQVYFVMFTTPAEARGQGGFMGNWAELSVNDGTIELTRIGRTTDLISGGDGPQVVTGPADWLDRYGPYGFQTGDEDVVGAEGWSIVTMSPNFPATAQVVAEMYPQSGGRSVDGVISLDVEAMAALLSVVGPVQVPGGPRLDGGNAAEFLLSGQYSIDELDRIDALVTVASQVLGRMLSGGVDDPLALGRALVEPARQGRLLVWARNTAVQAVVVESHLDGGLFQGASGAGSGEVAAREGVGAAPIDVSLRFVNGAPNKIDVYLDRAFCVFRDDGRVVVEATVTNTAPASGLPDVVLGNQFGLPWGTNRSLVFWYSSAPVREMFIEGESVAVAQQREAEAFVETLQLDLGPGESKVLRFEFTGVTAAGTAITEVTAWPQPLVLRERWGTAQSGTSCDETTSVDSRSRTLSP